MSVHDWQPTKARCQLSVEAGGCSTRESFTLEWNDVLGRVRVVDEQLDDWGL